MPTQNTLMTLQSMQIPPIISTLDSHQNCHAFQLQVN
jgi:hypothetical protein